jgi:hypothetical protein
VESSAAADGSTLHSTNYVKVFLEVRSQYLDQIFQPTIKACTKSLEGLGGTGSTSSYSRNSSPFLAFTLGLLYMANHEYRLLQSMLNTAGGQQTLTITGIATAPSLLGASASRSGKRHLMSTTMEQLIGPLLDSYRGCADGILKRFRKGTVQNREYGLQFLALDCLANFVNQMASTRKK